MGKTTFSVKDVLEKFVQEMEDISQSQAAVNRHLESNLIEIDRRLADLEIAIGITGVDPESDLAHSSESIEFEQQTQLERMSLDLENSLVKDVASEMTKKTDQEIMEHLK